MHDDLFRDGAGDAQPSDPAHPRAKVWQKRVLLWCRSRFGAGVFPVGGFAGAEWEYKKFLAAWKACRVETDEHGGDPKELFNTVDRWARPLFGNSWFCSHSWEHVSDAWADAVELGADVVAEDEAYHDRLHRAESLLATGAAEEEAAPDLEVDRDSE